MSWKLHELALSLLVTSPVIRASAPLIVGLGVASSITDLIGFTEDLLEKIFDKSYEWASDTLVAVQQMNNDVHYKLGEISNILKELPLIIDQKNKPNKLQDHVNRIGFDFNVKVGSIELLEAFCVVIFWNL